MPQKGDFSSLKKKKSHLQPMDLIITILHVVTKDLPISPQFTPCDFFIAMQVQHSYNSSTNDG